LLDDQEFGIVATFGGAQFDEQRHGRILGPVARQQVDGVDVSPPSSRIQQDERALP
jgi:hypothetical protein